MRYKRAIKEEEGGGRRRRRRRRQPLFSFLPALPVFFFFFFFFGSVECWFPLAAHGDLLSLHLPPSLLLLQL